jgi:hypothetical protein
MGFGIAGHDGVERRAVEVDEHGADEVDVLGTSSAREASVDGHEDAGAALLAFAQDGGEALERAEQGARDHPVFLGAVVEHLEDEVLGFGVEHLKEASRVAEVRLDRRHRLGVIEVGSKRQGWISTPRKSARKSFGRMSVWMGFLTPWTKIVVTACPVRWSVKNLRTRILSASMSQVAAVCHPPPEHSSHVAD